MWNVTVRMAWHDRAWDGRICSDPAGNAYCTGTHSLLSERLAREKSLDPNLEKSGEKLDFAMPNYLPPCFWTSSAFAEGPTNIVHRHPFGKWKEKKKIPGRLSAHAVYTWPFRLAMTHSQDSE